MWKRIKAYKKVILTTALIAFSIGLIAEAFIEYGILRHDISLLSIVILSLTKWVALYLLWLGCNMTRDKGKSAEIAWLIHWGIVFIIYTFIVKMIVDCVTVDIDNAGEAIWALYFFAIAIISWYQSERMNDSI